MVHMGRPTYKTCSEHFFYVSRHVLTHFSHRNSTFEKRGPWPKTRTMVHVGGPTYKECSDHFFTFPDTFQRISNTEIALSKNADHGRKCGPWSTWVNQLTKHVLTTFSCSQTRFNAFLTQKYHFRKTRTMAENADHGPHGWKYLKTCSEHFFMFPDTFYRISNKEISLSKNADHGRKRG